MEQGFHFIRPLWLLLLPIGPLLLWWWGRRNDPLQRWKGMIAPHLLAHLVVGDSERWHPRPIHLVCAVLILGSLACAGPTWELESPPFAEDRAPLVVAMDLSAAMNAMDVSPTRLERAKQKVRDLMALRVGGRTGLIVYTSSAHMVLPPTDDAALMEMFLSALSTDLLPAGKGLNAGAALTLADKLLNAESDPGTIVFFTSGFDDAQIPAFVAHRQHSRQQVLMLAVGTTEGGPLRGLHGQIQTGSDGTPLNAKLDDAALQRLSTQAHIPLASVTSSSEDMQWVQREAVHHLQIVKDNSSVHWKEYGYFLCYPLVLIALFWFRRGWMVRWVFVFGFAGLAMHPSSAMAADWHVADWFFTPDQQGRWYYEHRDFEKAAQHFQDPTWKGWALYQHGRWDDARKIFETLPGADAKFMTGNSYAHQFEYEEAKEAYDEALRLRHPFPDAEANLRLMVTLIKQRESVPAEDEDDESRPDQVKQDKEGAKGKGKMQVTGKRPSQLPADVWMRNLSVSPADFLRTKFSIEEGQPAPAPASSAAGPQP
jgi:Ca-activated chloride channel family protein